MTRRIPPLVLAVVSLLSTAAADWRVDIARYFETPGRPDYAGALAYLAPRFEAMSEEDKASASGLLAYLEARLGDRPAEYRRLGDYFERYGAIDVGFQFLPPGARSDFYRYVRDWQLKYPWVMKMGIVWSSAVTVSSSLYPPDSVILGIEMAGEALYKLSADGVVVKGGMFRRGFNEIVIDAAKMFQASGNYAYTLEFKTGDLVIRRTLIFGLRRESYGQVGPRGGLPRTAEYVIKLYLGERLLAANQRTAPVSTPLDIPVPSPSGKYDPFGPGYQNEPRYPTGVPIAALPQAVKEIVDLLKKRNEIEPVPPVELKTDTQYVFSEQDPNSPPTEVRAHLWLDLKSIQFLSYSAQK